LVLTTFGWQGSFQRSLSLWPHIRGKGLLPMIATMGQ
jgi:hypothetical protein